jgi:hypothetical protein
MEIQYNNKAISKKIIEEKLSILPVKEATTGICSIICIHCHHFYVLRYGASAV